MHFDILEYEDYLKNLSKKDLRELATHQLLTNMALQEKVKELKKQCSRSNSEYLSRCRSVGGVTLPPGV